MAKTVKSLTTGPLRRRCRPETKVPHLDIAVKNLGEVSRQYIRTRGSPSTRVVGVVSPQGSEIFDHSSFETYLEWKHHNFSQDNIERDKQKSRSSDRAKARKKMSWTKNTVSGYLRCTLEELDLILSQVAPIEMKDCLIFLGLLPESARKPLSFTLSPRVLPKPVLSTEIPLTPCVDDRVIRRIGPQQGSHPLKKTRFHISEALFDMDKWNSIEKFKKTVSAHAMVMRSSDMDPSNVYPKFIHISSSEMRPWFRYDHYDIDVDGFCSLKEISDVPKGKRADGIPWIISVLIRGRQKKFFFKDNNIIYQNKFGLQLDPHPSASITITSPNITFWKNQRVAAKLLEKEIAKGWVRSLSHVDSNHFTCLANGFAQKPGSEELRPTIDASGPHAPDVNGLALAINDRQKKYTPTNTSFEWANAPDTIEAISFISAIADSLSPIRPHIQSWILVSDLSNYYRALHVCRRDEAVSNYMSFDEQTAAANFVKALTSCFGLRKLPEWAQRTSHMTDYVIYILMSLWYDELIGRARTGNETAKRYAPPEVVDLISRRSREFLDPRQGVLSVTATYMDDTPGADLSWLAVVAHAVYYFIVQKRLCTPIHFGKLQLGRLAIVLGLEVNLVDRLLSLSPRSIRFWREYIKRVASAIFIEFHEFEKILGKLSWALEVRRELKIFTPRMSKFLHNSGAWSKQDNGLVIAPFATWIKKDLINNILLPLLASPCRPLTLFSPLVPREGSLRSLTDSCRNLRPEEICALGGISLCGRKALVWLFPLSMLARQILPIHVTEGTANLVACFVNFFFFSSIFDITTVDELIDNQAALTALTSGRSKDIRLIEILMLKSSFQLAVPDTSFRSSYIQSAYNPGDLPSHGDVDNSISILTQAGFARNDITIASDVNHPCFEGVGDLIDRLCLVTQLMNDENKSRYFSR